MKFKQTLSRTSGRQTIAVLLGSAARAMKGHVERVLLSILLPGVTVHRLEKLI